MTSIQVAWRAWGVGLGCLVACQPTASGTDAASGPRCNPTAPFGRQVSLDALNSLEDDEQATLSADELTLYFSRGSAPNYDIYQATRTSTAVAFGSVVLVP